MRIKTEPDDHQPELNWTSSKEPQQSISKLEELVQTRMSHTSTFNYDLDQASGYVEFKLPANIVMPIKTWNDLQFLEDLLFVNHDECFKFVRICFETNLKKKEGIF